METNNSEIDIIELLVKIVKFTKQYILFFVILIIVGIIFGILTNKKQTVYTSEMIGTTDLISDYYYTNKEGNLVLKSEKNIQEIVEIINTLNKINIENELGINKTSNIIATIINNEKEDSKETLENFKITVVFSEQTDVSNLYEKINNYLSQNKYVKSKFEEQEQQNTALIEKINSEIEEIDSLQKLILSSKKIDNEIVYEKNSQIINLFEKKLALEKKNNNKNPLVSITNFYPVKEKTSDNKIKIIITTIIFLIIGVLIALIKELLKISKNA